jgi:hypothetical protein
MWRSDGGDVLDDNEAFAAPDVGNYGEYSLALKAILDATITVNTKYHPANGRVFPIMFYDKEISEPTVRAVVGEEVSIVDPLVEYRHDIVKAYESSIIVDVLLKDVTERVFTLDMQRAYLKRRNRNRQVYYGAKELAAQIVIKSRYEDLKQISITFIYEENTTPGVPPTAKIQLTDVNTSQVYTDLFTLYEVNLNKITDGRRDIPETLLILKAFLMIRTHGDLCRFVNTYDTDFSRKLVIAYMNAIADDALLMKIGGTEKAMYKLTEEDLMEEREEGRAEGKLIILLDLIMKKRDKMKSREQIINELELGADEIKILDNFDEYAHLLETA